MPRKEEAPGRPPDATDKQLAAELAAPGTADQRRAAEKRRAAAERPDRNDDGYLSGLLAERRGFVQRGDEESTATIDAEIVRVGGTPPAADEQGKKATR